MEPRAWLLPTPRSASRYTAFVNCNSTLDYTDLKKNYCSFTLASQITYKFLLGPIVTHNHVRQEILCNAVLLA